MYKLFLFFLFLCTNQIFAQKYSNYTPILNSSFDKEELKKEIKEVHNFYINSIDSKYEKEIKRTLNASLEYVNQFVDSNYFYNDSVIVPYMNNILNTVIRSNQELKNYSLRLFVSSSTIPNAFSLGNGIIVFNIGLLRYLKSESQIAFVLCHEIAHIYAQHIIREISNNIEYKNSDEFKQKLKNIKESKYYTLSKIDSLLSEYTFDFNKHGRFFEFESDSIGLVFLSKTPYNTDEAKGFLQILDSVDVEKYRDSLDISKLFDFDSFHFKSNWIKESSFFSGMKMTVSQELIDTMKTHPDCDKRILKLDSNLLQSSKSKFIQSEALFDSIVYLSDFDYIRNLYESDIIGGCFYMCLKYLNTFPDNVYLYNTIAKCYLKIRSGLINHNLTNYLGLASRYIKSDYKQINLFLNNIRLSELDEVIFLFLEQHLPQFKNNEEYLYYIYLAAKNTDRKNFAQDIKKNLETNYKNGTFTKQL